MIRLVWSTICVRPIVDHITQIGTTWLEFYILHTLAGGTAAHQPSDKRHLKVRFVHDCAQFRHRSKRLFAYSASEASHMLIPYAVTNAAFAQPLAHYGLFGKLPMLNMRLAPSQEQSWQLHAALCSFGCKLKGKLRPRILVA